MEEIVLTLRHCTDNEKRGALMARLRYLQEQQPQNFLSTSWKWISSPQYTGDDRFFVAALVLSFVNDSWRSWEGDKNTKGTILQKYIDLALGANFPSEALCRKLGSIIAVMAKFGPKSSEPAALPPFIPMVVDAYLAVLHSLQQSSTTNSSCSSPSMMAMGEGELEKAAQALLLLHVFLKEVHTKRIGKVFEKVCQYIAPFLSQTLTLFPFSFCSSNLEYMFALRGLKCAYRVFGCGFFHPPFYAFLLQQAWEVADRVTGSTNTTFHPMQRLPPTNGSCTRVLDYVVKIFQNLVVSFPSQLHQLPTDFFLPIDPQVVGTSFDRSLLYFLFSSILSSGKESVHDELISEKCVCRSMNIFTVSLTAEESDDFVKEYLKRFTASPLLAPLMQTIITRFLADDCSPEAMDQWDESPEKGLEELEVECDDELSTASCAEQLFLALTGSDSSAPACLNAAWSIVKNLFHEGQEMSVTAALHAVGIGYYTMRDNSDYLSFLKLNLLPILRNSTGALGSTEIGNSSAVSFAVLRRVVWMVGMWCESVPEVSQRQQVHTALADVLLSCTPTSTGRGLMLALTALRSVENFVSDEHFTVDELHPPALLESILQSVARILPHLRCPSVVKQQVGFLYVLMEKGCIPPPGGNRVLALLLPTIHELVGAIHTKAASSCLPDREVEDNGNNSTDDEDNMQMRIPVVSALLECLGAAVKISSDTELVWNLLPVVMACAQPEGVLAAYVEEEAWELLYTMVRYSSVYVSRIEEALQWCLLSVTRDFASLSTVLSCVAACVLCSNLPAEQFFSPDQVIGALRSYRTVVSAEVSLAYLSFFLTLAVQSNGPLRCLIAEQSLSMLALWPDDVQARDQPLQLALLLAIGLQDASNSALLLQLRQIVEATSTSATFSLSTPEEKHYMGSAVSVTTGPVDLVEKILLLLDVASNVAYTRALYSLLRVVVVQCHIQNPSVKDAAHLALQQHEADLTRGVHNSDTIDHGEEGNMFANLYEETEEEQKERAIREVTANTTIPSNTIHYQRVLKRFSSVLFFDELQNFTELL